MAFLSPRMAVQHAVRCKVGLFSNDCLSCATGLGAVHGAVGLTQEHGNVDRSFTGTGDKHADADTGRHGNRVLTDALESAKDGVDAVGNCDGTGLGIDVAGEHDEFIASEAREMAYPFLQRFGKALEQRVSHGMP